MLGCDTWYKTDSPLAKSTLTIELDPLVVLPVPGPARAPGLPGPPVIADHAEARHHGGRRQDHQAGGGHPHHHHQLIILSKI